jgi:hypothetical protein
MFCTSLVNVYSDRSLEQQSTSRHSNALFWSTSSRHPVELPLALLIFNPRGAAATNTNLGLTLTITERAIHPCQDEYNPTRHLVVSLEHSVPLSQFITIYVNCDSWNECSSDVPGGCSRLLFYIGIFHKWNYISSYACWFINSINLIPFIKRRYISQNYLSHNFRSWNLKSLSYRAMLQYGMTYDPLLYAWQ